MCFLANASVGAYSSISNVERVPSNAATASHHRESLRSHTFEDDRDSWLATGLCSDRRPRGGLYSNPGGRSRRNADLAIFLKAAVGCNESSRVRS